MFDVCITLDESNALLAAGKLACFGWQGSWFELTFLAVAMGRD